MVFVRRKPTKPQPTLFTMSAITAYNLTCGRHFAYQCNRFRNLLEVSVILENGL